MSLRAAFWLSLALMMAGVALMVLWSAPRIEAGGLRPFDIRTGGYTYDEARAFLAALTPEGLAAYLGPQRLADTIFPIGFLGVLALGIVLGLRRWSVALAVALALVPLGYFVLDMLENAKVAGLLRAGPDGLTPDMVARASAITLWKYRLVNASLAILGLAWAARGVAALRRGR
ncbi:hypothetical protein [Sinisalibacter aestuarii]|uniref:DUF1772 domain-containing protein n=1 Tax=Sinisalibacter aestuarii TaxID=2949426 RepID=A0ABQ5LVB4_9RHOB|nr:hypothetical protein [Sinisalibacter aestuarii]GKY88925.1 hypothetical protein STA1M1_27940 [Sinisalibacter aestuarii]